MHRANIPKKVSRTPKVASPKKDARIRPRTQWIRPGAGGCYRVAAAWRLRRAENQLLPVSLSPPSSVTWVQMPPQRGDEQERGVRRDRVVQKVRLVNY